MKITLAGALAGGAALFAAGAASVYLITARSPAPAGSATAATASAAGDAKPPAAGAAIVQLDAEQIRRVGIRIEAAAGGTSTGVLRAPATVQPDAYTRVVVTPLVSGRVTRVPIELGERVRAGQTIAEVYSPDLADARSRYLSAKSDAETAAAKLARTERLAALGSASRQEIEDMRAELVRQESAREQAAARLRLLHVDPASVEGGRESGESDAIVRVPAPRAGLVIERPATPGTTAEPATPLAVIAQLSPVWVLADVPERDIGRIAVGAPATVTMESYPGLELHGRATYIAPDVRPDTRTTEVRVEVDNPDGKLRFGMFVSVDLHQSAREAEVTVPRGAVQIVGARDVVFVADASTPGRFTERAVTLGSGDESRVVVESGLAAGEPVAVTGTFALRAEAERGPRPDSPAGAPVRASVEITERGFEPQEVPVPAGRRVELTFTRRTDQTCATEVAVPSLTIRKPLPLNQPVTIELPAASGGSVGFQCGMAMLKGAVVVR